MRLDKFLKVLGLMKRRTVANEAAAEGFIMVNGAPAKPSYTVKTGDVIELDMWNFYKKVTVLNVPGGNSVAKAARDEFVRTDEYRTKDPADDL